jgi:DNA-binding SARP family transcriptional activator
MRNLQLNQQADTNDNWPVMICLLGTFRVLVAGQPVPLRNSRKVEGLLSALSVRIRCPIPREVLLDMLWPYAERSLAGHSLNTLIHSLRKLLQPWLGNASPILHEYGCYSLNLEAGICVDTNAFESLLKIGELETRAGNADAATLAYNRAVQLYEGDLAIGTDLQAVIERERLRAKYLTLLARLADDNYKRDNYSNCVDFAHQLLANDPCREDAHRMLMRCYVKLGERAQALRQYQVCELALKSEFGATPEPATRALCDQIRDNPDLL